jgi:hypothetical protein
METGKKTSWQDVCRKIKKKRLLLWNIEGKRGSFVLILKRITEGW